MEILYATHFCSKQRFKEIFDMCKIKPLQSIQKFNELFCSGMVKDENINLSVITSAPVNRKMCKKVFWNMRDEIEDNINFFYCFMINLPIIKFITLLFSSLVITLKWCRKTKNSNNKFVIYDAYCPIIANVAALIGNWYGAKVIALYTDVPKCMNDSLNNNNNIIKKLFKKMYNFLDNTSNKLAKGYILLTEQMNEVVNINKKPYIVIEGFADNAFNLENDLKNKYDKFTIMYAGGLYSKFGIECLMQAIERIGDDVQLLLFGEGELVESIKEYSKNRKNIIYGGTLPNYQIVKEEIKSTVLINPRFSNEEYTKYSFPSKNMEYMVSGTPLLTTKLPGISNEYDDYVYYILKEDVEGFVEAICELKKMSRQALHEKGMMAQEFVLKNKNNVRQAGRFIEFIKGISCNEKDL